MTNKGPETSGIRGVYHYHSKGSRSPKGPEGRKRMPRSQKIILMDILVIVVIAGILIPLVASRSSKGSLDGASFQLKTYKGEGTLLTSLLIEGAEEVKEGEIRVIFSFGEEEKTKASPFPEAGEILIIRAVFPYDGEKGSLNCSIETDNGSVSLKTAVGGIF